MEGKVYVSKDRIIMFSDALYEVVTNDIPWLEEGRTVIDENKKEKKSVKTMTSI